VAFGIHNLCQVLPEFGRRYPDARVDLSLTDRVVDLVSERFDVAVRIGALADSSLMQRKVSEMRRMICASPSYLETAGVPKSPEDLADHRVIALSGIGDFDEWPFCDGKGAVRRLGIRPAIVSDTAEAVLQLGLSGAGIFRLGDNTTARHVADGRLVRLLDDVHHAEPVPISLVFATWTAAIAACARVRRFHR
jgi:DNA-binding transcriptional LysR family regulator